MPVTRRQFELEIYDEMESIKLMIYLILSLQRHLAYSETELLEICKGNDGSRKEQVLQALKELANTEAVEVRELGGEDYYAFNREVDTDTWEPK